MKSDLKFMRTFLLLCKDKYFWISIALVAFISILYYAADISAISWLAPDSYLGITRRAFERSLFIIPILIVAWKFGFKAGLTCSIVSGLIMTPRVIASPWRADAAAETMVIVALGIMTSWLISALEKARISQQSIAAELKIANEELQGEIIGRRRAEEQIRKSNSELAAVNKELEAFSYFVSHDLRAPLRSIDGFSQVLLEDYAGELDVQGKDYLQRVRSATQRMGQLIDDLLSLSRVTRNQMKNELVDLSSIADSIAMGLQKAHPERKVKFSIMPGLNANGDPHLLWLVLENLLGNAWKFTEKHQQASIEFGSTRVDGKQAFFICDDGAGFDMSYVDKMFAPFQRLHSVSEFPGTGIGLATVQRIVHRHGGRVWAKGEIEKGATFYFTLDEIHH
ncbi:MAG: hypothetical protein JXB43_00340 [Dehalococcoidia bacterium]|nr:hypothetical protein [Dehalococcoidia bacterium]